jgi:type I restriction enzyme R subunit
VPPARGVALGGPWCDPDLERLYSYTTVEALGSDVALEYYRIQRVWSGAIDLKGGEDETVKSPTDVAE